MSFSVRNAGSISSACLDVDMCNVHSEAFDMSGNLGSEDGAVSTVQHIRLFSDKSFNIFLAGLLNLYLSP